MKIQALYDLQQDVNRLFVAGSRFAKGDPRLTKYIPVFQKLGEKAPVFKKIALDIDGLLQAGQEESAEKLTSLSILLYSVLYTQGDALEEGLEKSKLSPMFSISEIQTDNTYLQLKPVIQALKESNPGRLEILKDAMERSVFKDFRTYQYLDDALGDKYSELADYVAGKIIPSIGAPMLSYLRNGFKPEDKTEQNRRLKLLHQFGHEDIPKLIEGIMAENLPGLQAEAIAILAEDKKNESFILQLADDKNKTVRQAAYNALAKFETEASLGKLVQIYKSGKNTDIAVQAISASSMPYFFNEILEQFNTTRDKLFQLDKTATDKDINAAFGRYEMELGLFNGKEREEVYQVIEQILTGEKEQKLFHAKKNVLGYTLKNLIHKTIAILYDFDANRTLEFYKRIVPTLSGEDWAHDIYKEYFRREIEKGLSGDKLYGVFSGYFVRGYIDIDDIYRAVYKKGTGKIDLDILSKEWIKIIYRKGFESSRSNWDYSMRYYIPVLDAYLPRPSQEFNTLVTGLVQKFPSDQTDFVFDYLLAREVPNRFELIYNNLKSNNKRGYYWIAQLVDRPFWKTFPVQYADKFRELQKQTNNDRYGDIAYNIEQK